ncbi:peptidyl-prolyl cis-trans isomerase, EpsD family [Duganella sp. SAP-35]|uniref:peptidylprolyl isomerase n=2 Tax=Duganella aceris TaxID=2703883 RepID=A0ABX0FUR8_9BURK|nr:peptidyl-prolyl cis-trans isomerase, EpsD family [Duganella aceris]
MNDKFVKRTGGVALAVLIAASLSACGGKTETKSGQALARIDGDEITISQLNEELQRAGVQPAQQEAASKQVLAGLVDRQLLQNAAAKDKTDRDPKVVQAIERAKALIVAQAYLQKRMPAATPPTSAQVGEYFDKHPEFFSNRKQFDMRQLQFANADMSDDLKKVIDKAGSLDEVAGFMDSKQIKYSRAQVSRTSADLPSEMSKRLLALEKNALFIVKEGDRSVLSQVADVKDVPVTLAAVTPQIQQFLLNQRNKEAAEAELKRLRAAAKIEYLNPAMTPAAPKAAPAAATPDGDATARGVAGLK